MRPNNLQEQRCFRRACTAGVLCVDRRLFDRVEGVLLQDVQQGLRLRKERAHGVLLDTSVCEKTLLSFKLFHCTPAIETTIVPLIWWLLKAYFPKGFSPPEECLFAVTLISDEAGAPDPKHDTSVSDSQPISYTKLEGNLVIWKKLGVGGSDFIGYEPLSCDVSYSRRHP